MYRAATVADKVTLKYPFLGILVASVINFAAMSRLLAISILDRNFLVAQPCAIIVLCVSFLYASIRYPLFDVRVYMRPRQSPSIVSIVVAGLYLLSLGLITLLARLLGFPYDRLRDDGHRHLRRLPPARRSHLGQGEETPAHLSERELLPRAVQLPEGMAPLRRDHDLGRHRRRIPLERDQLALRHDARAARRHLGGYRPRKGGLLRLRRGEARRGAHPGHPEAHGAGAGHRFQEAARRARARGRKMDPRRRAARARGTRTAASSSSAKRTSAAPTRKRTRTSSRRSPSRRSSPSTTSSWRSASSRRGRWIRSTASPRS